MLFLHKNEIYIKPYIGHMYRQGVSWYCLVLVHFVDAVTDWRGAFIMAAIKFLTNLHRAWSSLTLNLLGSNFRVWNLRYSLYVCQWKSCYVLEIILPNNFNFLLNTDLHILASKTLKYIEMCQMTSQSVVAKCTRLWQRRVDISMSSKSYWCHIWSVESQRFEEL